MPCDPAVDTYIEDHAPFARPILVWLRERVHAAVPEAEEAIKWRMPFFMYRGRPLANMAAFKAHASFGFWGSDATPTRLGRLERLEDLPEAAGFEALVRAEADRMDARGACCGSGPTKPEAEVPPELAKALAGDVQAAANFAAFVPSARRDYCEWIAQAKRPDTRLRRITDAVAWIRDGKRRNWKYEK